MKENRKPLKLFNFSTPLMNTEVFSIAGDKYESTLPFSCHFVDDFGNSDVVLWDGVITTKNKKIAEKVLSGIGPSRILLLLGESATLLKDHPLVELVNPEHLNCIEIRGWNLLPEEFLQALSECHKKLQHV